MNEIHWTGLNWLKPIIYWIIKPLTVWQISSGNWYTVITHFGCLRVLTKPAWFNDNKLIDSKGLLLKNIIVLEYEVEQYSELGALCYYCQ